MNKPLSEPIVPPVDRVVAMERRSNPAESWIVPGRKADPISSFRAHRMLAIGLMFGVSALGVFLFRQRSYRAEATIRVTPTFVASLAMTSQVRFDSNVEYHDYVQQQIYEIESYQAAVKALDLLGPERKLFQEPDETASRAAERLMKLIDVRSIPDSYLVSIGLEGSDPAVTADVVNAVAKAYLNRHGEQDSALNSQRLQQLTDRKTRLEEQVRLRAGQLDLIARDLGTSSFDSGAANPYEKMRADTATALSGAKEALIKARSHIAVLKEERNRPQALELNLAAEQTVDNTLASSSGQVTVSNGGQSDATAELRTQREAAFLELRGLAPNHPGRKAIESKIADIEAEIQRIRGDYFTSLLDAAETRLEEAQREEQALETQLSELDKQAAEFASKFNEGLAIQAAMGRGQREVQDIDDRLNSVLTEAHTPGIVQLEAAARIPDLPEKGKRRKMTLVFGLLALVLGVGVPTFIDLTDSRLRSVRELEEIIGIPALGLVHLAHQSKEASSRDLLRRMALAILRERRGSGNRVFVLTSVDKGSGTTSLVLALECELTLLGVNAVALAANALSPDPHYCHSRLLDGGQVSPGSNGALCKNGEPAAQLHVNDIDQNVLSDVALLRPQGDIEIIPERLQHLLDEELKKHDIVLLDAAPLLDSAETEMLIQIPAATILIVQAGRDRVERVRAAADALSRISPPVVGTVLIHHSSTSVTQEQTPAARPEPAAAHLESFQKPTQPTLARDALASRGT